MKNGLKRVSRRVLSTLLCLLILLSTMSVGFIIPASAANFTQGKALFLYPSHSDWTAGGERYAAYFYNSSTGAKYWSSMLSHSSNFYTVQVPSTGTYDMVIFCRMNGAYTTNDWNYKWNQTVDISASTAYNCYKVSSKSGEKYSGSWSTYDDVVYISTDYDNWSKTLKLSRKNANEAVYEGTFDFEKSTSGYEFKLLVDTPADDTWYGNNGDFTDSASGWTMSTAENNCKIKTSGGKYKFSFNLDTKKLTVTYTDTIPPEITSMDVSGNEVTLNFSDNKGIASYTWNGVTTSTSSTSVTKTVTTGGTYTATVEDSAGNPSESKSITLYKSAFNANGGSCSTSEIYSKSGETVTYPTPTRKGYSFEGWSTDKNATSGETGEFTPEELNTTYYAIWSKGYALAGNINGEDVTTVIDSNVFNEKGELTVNLTHSGNVYVKAKSGDVDYKFNGICEENSGSLFEGGNGTMFVPAGNIKFKLDENTDGTLTLSYDVLNDGADAKSTYTLNGSWGESSTFRYISSNTLSTTVFLKSNDAYTYNVKNGEDVIVEDTGLPASGGIYTFTLNTETNEVTVEHSSDLTYYFAISDDVLSALDDFEHLRAFMFFTNSDSTTYKEYEAKDTVENTHKTYEGKTIYKITVPYGACLENTNQLNFLPYNSETWLGNTYTAIGSATSTVSIHNKMFVYDGAEVNMRNYKTDSELPVPTFVLNGGVTTVTTREDLVFTFTCLEGNNALPDGTIVTLNDKEGKPYESFMVGSGTTSITLTKGTLSAGEYTVTATADNGTKPTYYSLTFTVDNGKLTYDYYLVGKKIGNGIDNIKYPMIENADADDVYQILSIPYSYICGSGSTFRFTDGVNFYTPESNTTLTSQTTSNGRLGYTTNAAAKIENADTTSYTCLAPSNWNYVNLYWDTVNNNIWVTQVDNYGYDSSNVSVTLKPSDAEVAYNNSVTFTSNVSGQFTFTTDGEEYNPYESNLTYKLYKMNSSSIYPEGDELIDTVTIAQGNEVVFTDTIKNSGKYYVIVSPAANTNIRVASNVSTITAVDEVKEALTDIYFDFSSLSTVPENATLKILNTKTNEFTEVELSKLDGSNTILTGKANLYYSVSTSSKVTSKSLMYTLTAGDTTMYFAESDQPNMSKVKDTSTIWYKSVGTTLNTASVQYDDYVIDEDLTITEEDTPKLTLGSAKYEKIRIYVTDSAEYKIEGNWWKGHGWWSDDEPDNIMKISYTSDAELSTATFSDFTEMKTTDKMFNYLEAYDYLNNGKGQKYFYFDIPINTTYIKIQAPDGVVTKSGETTTSAIAIQPDADYNTHNAFYISDDGSSIGTWKDGDEPESPIVISYYNSVSMDLTDTVNITPMAYFKTVTYELASGADVVQLSNDGTVTPREPGTATIKITPHGKLNDTFDASEVTITVVDKSALRTMIANAQKAIETQKSTPRYTRESYEAVLKVYNGYEENGNVIKGALEIYRNSFDQEEINAITAQLKEAIGYDGVAGLVPLNYAEESASSVDVISYKTAVADIQAVNGTINSVTSNGAVVKNDDTYKVTYAAYDGTSNFDYNLTATSSANPLEGGGERAFVQWTANNNIDKDNTGSTLKINTSLNDSTVFVAEYADDNPKPVEIIYTYNDYDVDNYEDYEYTEGNEVSKTYTVTGVSVDASVFDNVTSITDLAERNAPVIVSQFYDYEFDRKAEISFKANKNDEGEIVSYTINATLANSMQTYTVSVNGAPLLDENGNPMKYHYQQSIRLNAADFSRVTDPTNVCWYYADNEDAIISTDQYFQFRVTENMELCVKDNNDGKTIDKVVVTHAYPELTIDANGTKKFHQNFYIRNYFDRNDESKEFIGGGVFYYLYNDSKKKPNSSKVTYSATDPMIDKDNLTNMALTLAQGGINVLDNDYQSSGYTVNYVDFSEDQKKLENNPDDPSVLFRYSSVSGTYNYYYDKSLTYNSKYKNYSYHLFAFYVYAEKDENGDYVKDENGNIIYKVELSDGYASAKAYLSESDIQKQ